MRQPRNVLVVPFRQTPTGIQYLLLKRASGQYWQFVAGGVEDEESTGQTAAREAAEEIGVAGQPFALSSIAAVPKIHFDASASWPDDVFIVREYAFAIDVGDAQITLSNEHSAHGWCPYDEAADLLKWDSNRTAMWELRERMKARIRLL